MIATGEPSTRPTSTCGALFAPRSIAVVGASPRSDLAKTVRDNLTVMGSATRCHFVNPKYADAWGQPCYPDLAALPEVPDAVLIALNPLRAAAVTQQAADVGARAVLIPGGGVVEGGEAAAQMQRDVRDDRDPARAGGHRPELHGDDRPDHELVASTSATSTRGSRAAAWPGSPRAVPSPTRSSTPGPGSASAGSSAAAPRSSSTCATTSPTRLDDPETHTIILFVEGFKRPERFLALADRALELGKPILAVKVGRSDQAQEAAVAHSGSIAGEHRVTDAALAAAGVVRCADLDELLEAAELHAGCRRLGRSVGRGRTGLVTVSTGEASLIADLATETGLDLPPVPDAARSAILADLPTMGYIGNPIDPWGAADESVGYPVVLRAFAAADAYDVLAIVHDFPYRSLPGEVGVALSVAASLAEATRDHPEILPVYISLTSGEPTPEVQALLEGAGGIPILRGAREAERAIVGRAWWEARRADRLADGPVRPTWPALAADRTRFGHDARRLGRQRRSAGPTSADALSELDSLAFLRAAGIPVVEALSAADPADAAAIARGRDGPFVVKLDAVGLAHKSDLGGVRLGLPGATEVEAAAADLLELGRRAGLDVRGVLVEPMVPAGLELIVGLSRDPQFGPAVVVGFGGVFAEVLDDVAIRIAPVDHATALAMLASLRGAPLLDGARGRPAVDRAALADLIVAVGRLGWERPDVVAVDLNPVIVTGAGPVGVDALVILDGPADV